MIRVNIPPEDAQTSIVSTQVQQLLEREGVHRDHARGQQRDQQLPDAVSANIVRQSPERATQLVNAAPWARVVKWRCGLAPWRTECDREQAG
jgi:hypothetical protein